MIFLPRESGRAPRRKGRGRAPKTLGRTAMKVFGDYHMHTRASDGRGTVLDKARRAAELGLEEIAIADHGTGSFLCHQTERKFRAQQREIARANDECGVRVLSGIEASITGESGLIDVPASIVEKCDVLTVGFHRSTAGGAVRRARRRNLWSSTPAHGSPRWSAIPWTCCVTSDTAPRWTSGSSPAPPPRKGYTSNSTRNTSTLSKGGGVHLGLGRAFHRGCRGLPLRPRIFETARHRGREGVRHRQKAGVPPEKGVHPHEMTE